MKKELISFSCQVGGNKEQTAQTEAAQTYLEMDISCYPFGTNKKHLQDIAKNYRKTHPQSTFEIFCDRHKIDPLTLNKKGLKQISRDFAEYLNQIRRRVGGRMIPLSQVYKDVRDYIEERKSYSCN